MTAKTITVEQFTKDLWEAQREDIRRNLCTAVADDDLEAHFPAWDRMEPSAREIRIKEVTEHLLQPLYLAGYEIRRKINQPGPQHD
jgi:hypothetical protein